MRKLLLLSFLLYIVLSVSAQNGKQPSNRSLPVVDITKDYPKKEMVLKDFVTVEYIPLETTDDVLLDNIAHLYTSVTDHYIVNCNSQEGTVFVFDRSGKIKHHFNHKGGSGEEYNYILQLRIDEKAKELYLLDNTRKLLVYSFEGHFKRRLPFPKDIRIEKMYNYDDQYLLCYDIYNLDWEKLIPNSCPYFLMSKKDGAISRLPITIQNRIGNCIHIQKSPTEVMTSSMTAFPMVSNGTEFVLSDLAGDTVFLYKNKKIIPLFTRTPKSAASDPRLMLTCTMKLGNYLFMSSMAKKIYDGPRIETKDFVYDLSTGTIYDGRLVIKDANSSGRFSLMGDNSYTQLPENCLLQSYRPDRLLKDYKEGKLKGQLKDIASKLSEDDNPVFMLITFKLK
ncbi:6-bladed beta-propeller [Bacteroides bouchesdurhonensis]